MMGERLVMPDCPLYEFRLGARPLLISWRLIDRFVDLSHLRHHLAGFYSPIGRPSVGSEMMIRMLIVG